MSLWKDEEEGVGIEIGKSRSGDEEMISDFKTALIRMISILDENVDFKAQAHMMDGIKGTDRHKTNMWPTQSGTKFWNILTHLVSAL